MLVSSGKMSTFATAKAAIAQLVEHDLAKVGVASSSLVCRSLLFDIQNQLRSIHTEETMPRWRNW